jgi:DNA-binding NtrC family response regulator
MNTKPTIILISRDNIFQTVLSKLILNRINIEIISLNSYTEVRKIKMSTNPYLILIDDVIIGATGQEMITFLRLEKKIFHPIIYFSNTEYEEDKKAIAHGANEFIQKPFNPEEAMNVILKYINKTAV